MRGASERPRAAPRLPTQRLRQMKRKGTACWSARSAGRRSKALPASARTAARHTASQAAHAARARNQRERVLARRDPRRPHPRRQGQHVTTAVPRVAELRRPLRDRGAARRRRTDASSTATGFSRCCSRRESPPRSVSFRRSRPGSTRPSVCRECARRSAGRGRPKGCRGMGTRPVSCRPRPCRPPDSEAQRLLAEPGE